MINRVFCYSRGKGERTALGSSVMLVLLIIVYTGLICIIDSFIDDQTTSNNLMTISIVFGFILFIGFIVKVGSKTATKFSAFATDTTGRIFKLVVDPHGAELLVGGSLAGGVVDAVLRNGKSTGYDIGGTIGYIAMLNANRKAEKLMQDPQKVASIIQNTNGSRGKKLYEILKVYSCTDKKNCIEIICDYQLIPSGKISYNKKMKVNKTYNYFEDLRNILCSKR